MSLLTKRILDLLIAVPLLIIISPLWLFIVIWIKWDSSGKAIFKQERVGLNGKLFTIYKFRTMVPNADLVMQAKIAKLKEDGNFDPENFVFQEQDDPRITRSGRFLRKTSLDELPQLINVINNTMSIVGPRPEIPAIAEQYTTKQRKRLEMLPGITGLAQINGRSDLTLSETLRYDIQYVENWNIWLDLKILFQTISVVLKGR